MVHCCNALGAQSFTQTHTHIQSQTLSDHRLCKQKNVEHVNVWNQHQHLRKAVKNFTLHPQSQRLVKFPLISHKIFIFVAVYRAPFAYIYTVCTVCIYILCSGRLTRKCISSRRFMKKSSRRCSLEMMVVVAGAGEMRFGAVKLQCFECF